MGSYLTQTGGTIAVAAGDLTDDLGNSLLAQLLPDGVGGISQSLVTKVISKAEGRINIRLAPLYTTPLSPVPDAIQSIALDFAAYYAYERKPEFKTRDGKSPVIERFKDAKEQLELFAKANAPLIDSTQRAESQLMGPLIESDDSRGWNDDAEPVDVILGGMFE